MKISLVLFFVLFQSYFLVLPNWNFATSVTDLLGEQQSIKYIIDERTHWYAASDKLVKEIKKDSSGKITHKNTYTMYWAVCTQNCDIYTGEVEFESIESFYGYVDKETFHPIICPKGSYSPYEIPVNHQKNPIADFNSTWIKNPKFDLKCFYHREYPFLVFYLMNGAAYVLRLEGSTLKEYDMYRFWDDFDEIYDFKLQNREFRFPQETKNWINPYPFMALVKKDNYLQIVATKYDMRTSTHQNIKSNNKKLIPIKKYTQAYFNNFHFNNSFFILHIILFMTLLVDIQLHLFLMRI